jgi:hypothetical protein
MTMARRQAGDQLAFEIIKRGKQGQEVPSGVWLELKVA